MGISRLVLVHKYACMSCSFIGLFGLLVIYFGPLILQVANWRVDLYFHISIHDKADRILGSYIFFIYVS